MPAEGTPAQRVVLGVTGGISAYKAVEVCRRLVEAGVHVAPVLTPDALRFVGKTTFSALGSEPAQSSLFEEASPIPHTRLGQSADLVLVVPATADFLARYAAGMANDLLTATLLATRAPVLVCPAMHTEMWEHPSVQENLDTLRRRGVSVVPPESGPLAAGDVGVGRLAEPETIVAVALGMLGERGDLAGHRVAVSAGGTREPIDPVRHLSNRSSGKQGHAVATAALRRGAEVTLVTTVAGALAPHPRLSVVRVDTAAEMEAALTIESDKADIIVMAAAVADYRPVTVATSKLTKEDGVPQIVLEEVPDILRALATRRRPGQVIVGFAAETEEPVARARRKREAKGVDLMVVNDVSAPGVGFDHDTNAVTIVSELGDREVPLTSKFAVADAVLDEVVGLLARTQGRAGADRAEAD
jgi:phosphopantothenoylcysteine decarboxylase/phosphopantothenate--cysteine ligase